LACQSEPEFDDAYAEARLAAAQVGAGRFAEDVLLGLVESTGAASFHAAELAIGAAVIEADLAAGLKLLAQAFSKSGHLPAVALKVRETFARWRDDAHETRKRRADFADQLARLAAEASVKRFHRLLDGATEGKIFVIGMNKTGTTSVKVALQQANVLCGPQSQHERLFPDWAQRRFDRIIDLCRYYEAFQDIPFSLPFTYQALDQAFPDARFILSVRDSAEQWYDSLVRFHTCVLFGGHPPSWPLIDGHDYAYPGALAECSRSYWRWQDFGLYQRDRAIALYERHNDNVREYFYGREGQLLVLNLSEPESYARFAAFLHLAEGSGRFGRYNAS
jgi:hypothetical protein